MPKAQAHLLIIEDDEVDTYRLQRLLARQQLRWPVTVLPDAALALDFLAERQLREPQVQYVVVLDLRLPRMHGLEFLKHLREAPERKAIPVIVLTGSDGPQDQHQAQQYQVAAYLHKREPEEVLGKVITEVIAKAMATG